MNREKMRAAVSAGLVLVVLCLLVSRWREGYAADTDTPKWIFQHIPHTSGRMLRDHTQPFKFPYDPKLNYLITSYHTPWSILEQKLPKLPAKIFAICRSPYPRLLGCYRHLVRRDGLEKGTTFKDFVEDLWTHHKERIVQGDIAFARKDHMPGHLRPAPTRNRALLIERLKPYTNWVLFRLFTTPEWVFTGTRDTIKCKVWRLEDGPSIYPEIYRYCGLPKTTPLPADRPEREWRGFYTPDMLRKVAALYADDFRLFGYDADK